MRNSEQRLFGVDFSASKQAGQLTWVCEVQKHPNNLLAVLSCRSLQTYSTVRLNRDTAFDQLVQLMTTTGPSLWGLDSSLSLPTRLLDTSTSWKDWATGLTSLYPTPEAFKHACLEKSHGKEWKRYCESSNRTPFASYNLRHYRQTYYGLTAIIAPLLKTGRLHVLPQQSSDIAAHETNLIEVCPASHLKKLDCYLSYKGNSPAHYQARASLLSRLEKHYRLQWPIEPDLRNTILNNTPGDALDALISACIIRSRQSG